MKGLAISKSVNNIKVVNRWMYTVGTEDGNDETSFIVIVIKNVTLTNLIKP